ncbi:MAG TPA: hypothetical protein VGE52_02320, partial [Pirellulales bacterium]
IVSPGYTAPAAPPPTYSAPAPAAPAYTAPAVPISPSTSYRPSESTVVTPSYPSTGTPTPAEPSTTHLPTYRNEGKVLSLPSAEAPRTTWSMGQPRFASQETPSYSPAPATANGVRPLDDGGWRAAPSR